MVSISTLSKNAFPLAGMKHSIKSLFPLAGKTASAVRLGIKKWKKAGLHLTSRIVSTRREKLRIKA